MLRVPFEPSVVAIYLEFLPAGYRQMTWGESVSKEFLMFLIDLEVNPMFMRV